MRPNAYRVYAGNRDTRFQSSQKCVGSNAKFSWPLGVIDVFSGRRKSCPKESEKRIGSQPVFSWLSSVISVTKRSTKNQGLTCQQRNAQHHSNTRRKNPARVRFSAERVFRETEKTRRRILDRRSPLQKAMQQNAKITTNHLLGYRAKVLRKI